MPFSSIGAGTGGAIDALTTRREDGTYTASNEEHIVSDGGTITLPSPTSDGIVLVSQYDTTRPSVEAPSGSIEGVSSISPTVDYPLVFVSDGANWYVSDSRDSSLSIPDSVVHQYPVSTFGTSTWDDNVGTADMSVNGMVSSTFDNGEDSVFGDGTDDYGLANGPQTLAENESFGIAFTFESTNAADLTTFIGSEDGESAIRIYDTDNPDGSVGQLNFFVRDDSADSLRVETDNTYFNGNLHLVVWNKSTNDGSGIDVYIDDMSTPASVTVQSDDGFDHTAYNNTQDMAFYANNSDGDIIWHKEFDAGVFEFNSEPYTQSERDELKQRLPEV